MTYRDIARLGGEGILTLSDARDLSEGVKAAFQFMQDGQWHSRKAIESNVPGSEAMRRVRELRAHGFTLEKKRLGVSRQWLYRLVENE